MEQKNENTITIDTTNLEYYRWGVEDKLYSIDNGIKTELLKQLDIILNNLKDYNSKEIKKEKEGLDIDFMLYDLNEYIDGLNKDKKLTNSLVFSAIKLVLEDFRKEYYKTIGIDISEEKEEDVSVNRVRYFDKYLNSEEKRREDIFNSVVFAIFCDESSTTLNAITQFELFNKSYNICLNKMNIGKKKQKQQEVYFEEDKEYSKSKSSSSISFSSWSNSITEDFEQDINKSSSSPVNSF